MDDLVKKIKELKKKRNAVILAHNYQRPEVQDVADFVGDSLELSREAAKTGADVIVFCGVNFMAETAKILSPEKTVLIPEKDAKCPMAAMINAEELRALKAKHPKAKVVCYVNTTAEVKAECDVCCTSANAAEIVNKIDADEIIFVPDKYLAANIKTSKKIIPWQGFCPTHLKIIPGYLKKLKLKYPNAKVVTHPECTPDVNRLSDAVLSTSQMLRFVKKDSAKTFIIGTEVGIIHRMQKENPGKKFVPASDLCVCPNMKMTTLESVYESLKHMRHKIKLDKKIITSAKKPISKMLNHSA
jgi:quinolinate synthase